MLHSRCYRHQRELEESTARVISHFGVCRGKVLFLVKLLVLLYFRSLHYRSSVSKLNAAWHLADVKLFNSESVIPDEGVLTDVSERDIPLEVVWWDGESQGRRSLNQLSD